MKNVILIISTDATRTGTPILLLNTLRWLNTNSNHSFILILHEGGELIDEFRSICPVYLWTDIVSFGLKKDSLGHLIYRGIRKIFRFGDKLACKYYITKLCFKYNVQIIYSNSARNGQILGCIMKYISSKVIVYVHEGKRTLELFNHQGFVTYNLNAGDKIITVSEAVKKVLEKDFKVKQNIEIVPGGVDLNYLSKDSANSYLKKEGIPSGSFIIMSCGWLDWHKGTDFFIQIAKILLVQNEKMHFVWIGGNLNDQEFKHMKFDIEKLNLSNRISIITSNSNAIDYIFSADIFLMLSREESFSLVTLEAGLAQKPVLCFQDSGGPTEIVNFDPRFIVPYADIIGMSKRIKDLSENENERQEMGKYLYNRIRDNYSIEKSASSLLNIINRELTNAY